MITEVISNLAVVMMDLPLLKDTDLNLTQTHMAVFASPWAGRYSVLSSPTQENFSVRTAIEESAKVGQLIEAIQPGPEGRWDLSNQLHLNLFFGSLESVADINALNGSNVVALETASGNWEIVQFTKSDLQADGSWILSKLLRAQLGTDAEMNEGSPAGSRIVFLDNSVSAVELSSAEAGLEQNWQIGPAREPLGSVNFASLTHVNQSRSQRMMSPASLSVESNASGGFEIAWIRRGRINSDSWESAEIPLDAAQENYRIRILDSAGQEKRSLFENVPSASYAQSDQLEDFGDLSTPFQVAISQIGDNGLAGSERILFVGA